MYESGFNTKKACFNFVGAVKKVCDTNHYFLKWYAKLGKYMYVYYTWLAAHVSMDPELMTFLKMEKKYIKKKQYCQY